jgi:hypothetical protein
LTGRDVWVSEEGTARLKGNQKLALFYFLLGVSTLSGEPSAHFY